MLPVFSAPFLPLKCCL